MTLSAGRFFVELCTSGLLGYSVVQKGCRLDVWLVEYFLESTIWIFGILYRCA